MAKAKKITQEELEAVRLAVSNFNRGKAALGDLEYQKAQTLKQTQDLEDALKAEQLKLEEIYGQITINLDSGEYEETVEEAQEV